MIRDPRGSVRRVKRESEVKTLAVSKVAPPSLLRASTEKTAKVAMGETTGEMYAARC